MTVLEDPPTRELPGRPLRQPLGLFSLLLCVALVAAGAFYAGVVSEKHRVHATPAVATTRGNARGGPNTGGPVAGPTGGATFGTVKLIDGSNVYVTDSTGTIVKVATTPASQITVSSAGSISNIKPGDTVIVTGSTSSDGTINATSIRDQGGTRVGSQP